MAKMFHVEPYAADFVRTLRVHTRVHSTRTELYAYGVFRWASGVSVKVGAAQVESAFLADRLATMPSQFGRAVGANRGCVFFHIRRRDVDKNCVWRSGVRSGIPSGWIPERAAAGV